MNIKQATVGWNASPKRHIGSLISSTCEGHLIWRWVRVSPILVWLVSLWEGKCGRRGTEEWGQGRPKNKPGWQRRRLDDGHKPKNVWATRGKKRPGKILPLQVWRKQDSLTPCPSISSLLTTCFLCKPSDCGSESQQPQDKAWAWADLTAFSTCSTDPRKSDVLLTLTSVAPLPSHSALFTSCISFKNQSQG
jgi:hypothetical protein